MTDEWGMERTSELAVRVLERPVGVAELLTGAPRAGETTTLTAAGSTDPDGRIVRVEWDFNADGHVDAVRTDARRSVAVRYLSAKSYTTAVTVVDDDGLRATATLPVDVE